VDARQLEYFLAIVDHDVFGRAAQQLHVSQPSLSQAVAALERDLGVLLFHRINRGVVISAAGSELIEPARQVLRDLRTTRATMDSL
jgi:DNA-binding transcriptional LysR family regulator